jgi:hypothetical protein
MSQHRFAWDCFRRAEAEGDRELATFFFELASDIFEAATVLFEESGQ